MEEKKFNLFGTDLQKIPCFKQTFMFSSCSGIAGGLGCFLFTSKIKRSADAAVLTFAVTTLGFWFYCRYNWSKQHKVTQQMSSSLHNVMLNEDAIKRTGDA